MVLREFFKQVKIGYIVEVTYLMVIRGEKVMRRRMVGVCFRKVLKRNHMFIGVYYKIRRERIDMFFDLNGTNVIDLKIISSNQ